MRRLLLPNPCVRLAADGRLPTSPRLSVRRRHRRLGSTVVLLQVRDVAERTVGVRLLVDGEVGRGRHGVVVVCSLGWERGEGVATVLGVVAVAGSRGRVGGRLVRRGVDGVERGYVVEVATANEGRGRGGERVAVLLLLLLLDERLLLLVRVELSAVSGVRGGHHGPSRVGRRLAGVNDVHATGWG